MFWRRRKLPEDDQPLVPHGLISQAMEDVSTPELPPDMLDSPKDVEQFPAEPVEMRLRVSAPVESRSQDTAPLPEQGRISPPLKWPRADEAEIARRAQGIDTAVSFPYRKPIVSAAVPERDNFEPEPEVAEPVKLEVVETPQAADPVRARLISVESQRFRNLLTRVRELRLPTLEPLRQRVHSAFSQARTTASTGFQSATNRLQEVRSKSGVALDAAKTRLVNRSNAALDQSRSGLQHLREGIRGADFSGAKGAWHRFRSWEVTVRIPASKRSFISSLLAFSKNSLMQTHGTPRRDSRLWASISMAAVSALLALGLISAVRHYGPDRVEAQPTSTPATPTTAPSKIGQSNLPVSSKPNIVAGPTHAKPSPIEKARATKPAAIATAAMVDKDKSSAPVAQKHRARRNTEEDDYVAKDSYVFYGNAGKR